ncbi:collagenase [Streptomyces sp. BE303]|uniref:collagenase n=1 Tax=Streptomyces sp. BE303 TaxID=3002528 RepID=UPI002E7A5457|nr:collagenase [Streptomyces sp. BE303]MED7947895.1 collagenase [Streptomyces sp. BE303]
MRAARPLHQIPRLARLLTLALALLLSVGLFAPRSQAAPAPASPQPGGGSPAASAAPTDPAPQPAIGETPDDHGKNRPVPARERAPFSTTAPDKAADSGSKAAKNSALAKSFGESAAAAAEQPCNVSDFTGRTGSALVQTIKSAELGCINDLFVLTGGDASGAFRESQMVTVANALRDTAAAYPGDNSTSTAQLVLYLRAGYFVQWYHASDVGTYGTALQNAIRPALDAFFGSAHSRDVTAANAATLGEAITLIDSAQENVRYLPVVKRLLGAYDATTHNPAGMGNALNSVFTVLWRGHQTAGFAAAVQADPSVLDTMYSFVTANNAQLGGDYSFLVYNATRELGRFLQYAPLKAKVRPLEKGLADQSSPSGRTAYQWAAAAEMAEAFDPGNCSYYGTCDSASRLKSAVLTVNYTCSPSIRIIAQALDSGQLGTACSSLTAQDAYFHAVAKDNGPVADDRNTTIEVVVFHSRFDYGVFAASVYGIDTNNGGMYLEGKPAEAGNQPRFLAYEADWARPEFQIWNLNHEYTHYLDGRFDMYGDFNAGMTTPTVWWVEGFAEYVSYSYRKLSYDAAISAAGLHTYKLSTLFDTTYNNSDSERVYRWGYLAVRYMLEQHRSDMDAVLAKYRSGDWAGARSYLTGTIGTRFDADFDRWLTACAAGSCGTTNPPGNQPPTAAFGTAIGELAVTFTDRSTDPDGSITARAWDFGDGTTATTTNPTKWYAKAGTYTVTLTVTDNKGATASSRQNVTVAGLPECSGADVRQLDKNCRRSNLAATTGNYTHFYLYLPAGVKQLKLTSTGGTGNADMYFNTGSWAYTNAYTARSVNASNNTETLTITNPPAGYVFVSLYGQQGFSGANIKAEY